MHLPATKKRTAQNGNVDAPSAKLPAMRTRRAVAKLYRTLLRAWGPQNWWPAESHFEVIVGAILTQNTAWTNVEKAMHNLRAAGMLSLESIDQADSEQLEILLRPAGYFRQKARRLQDITAFILAGYGKIDSVKCFAPEMRNNGAEDAEHASNPPVAVVANSELEKTYDGEHPAVRRMFQESPEKLRKWLLEQKGVGPETADSILLYGGNHAVFVVDAYTRRIFARHQLATSANDYETIRLLVESALREGPPADERGSQPGAPQDRPTIHQPSAVSSAYRSELTQRYNQFHALLVQVGKHFCLKKAPNCTNCPLARLLPMSDNAQAATSQRRASRGPQRS